MWSVRVSRLGHITPFSLNALIIQLGPPSPSLRSIGPRQDSIASHPAGLQADVELAQQQQLQPRVNWQTVL